MTERGSRSHRKRGQVFTQISQNNSLLNLLLSYFPSFLSLNWQ